MLVQTRTSTYKVEIVNEKIQVEKIFLDSSLYSGVKPGEILIGDSLLISPEEGMSLFSGDRRLLRTSSIKAI